MGSYFASQVCRSCMGGDLVLPRCGHDAFQVISGRFTLDLHLAALYAACYYIQDRRAVWVVDGLVPGRARGDCFQMVRSLVRLGPREDNPEVPSQCGKGEGVGGSGIISIIYGVGLRVRLHFALM